MYKLFLDDVRNPQDVQWMDMPVGPWFVVRNYNDFIETIKEKGVPILISFDHDLSIEHYTEEDFQKFLRKDYKSLSERTGYDCAKWLIAYCEEKNLDFPCFLVHSMNPVGKQNIIKCIESYLTFKQQRK